VKVSPPGGFKTGDVLWQGGRIVSTEEHGFEAAVYGRDALIVALKK
jgi:hypothetical protein